MIDDMQKTWETLTAVLLAVAGGLARLLSKKDDKKMNWGRMVSDMFVSGFTGLMALLALRAMGRAEEWAGVVCGMSGWIGPKVLDLIAGAAKKAAGIGRDDKKDE